MYACQRVAHIMILTDDNIASLQPSLWEMLLTNATALDADKLWTVKLPITVHKKDISCTK